MTRRRTVWIRGTIVAVAIVAVAVDLGGCSKKSPATEAPGGEMDGAADADAAVAEPDVGGTLEDLEHALTDLEDRIADQGVDVRSAEATPMVAGDAAKCQRVCQLAEAICDLEGKICELAEAHEDEERYAAACERAQADCERASEACRGCSG